MESEPSLIVVTHHLDRRDGCAPCLFLLTVMDESVK